jgi:hypothetical protein
MNDPHVKHLSYRLVLREPQAEWSSPPTVQAAQPDFVVTLEDEVARVEMFAHFPEVHEAQSSVEPFFRSWELTAALRGRRIRFEFENAEVVDRDPPAGEIGVGISDFVTARMTLTGSIDERMMIGQYPPPPPPMVVNHDVEMMLFRYEQFLEGREPLSGWVYFTVTYIEHLLAANLKDAASKFNVAESVLRELGRLTATVGDARSARKIAANWENRAHTQKESAFMLAATKRLIERVAEVEAVPASALPQITMEMFAG